MGADGWHFGRRRCQFKVHVCMACKTPLDAFARQSSGEMHVVATLVLQGWSEKQSKSKILLFVMPKPAAQRVANANTDHRVAKMKDKEDTSVLGHSTNVIEEDSDNSDFTQPWYVRDKPRAPDVLFQCFLCVAVLSLCCGSFSLCFGVFLRKGIRFQLLITSTCQTSKVAILWIKHQQQMPPLAGRKGYRSQNSSNSHEKRARAVCMSAELCTADRRRKARQRKLKHAKATETKAREGTVIITVARKRQ